VIDLQAIRLAVDPKAPQTGPIHCPVHGDTHPSLSMSVGAGDRLLVCCHAGCEQGAVFDEVRRRAGPLLNGHRFATGTDANITYVYRDAKGEPIARVIRTERADGGKDFRQQTPDGQGGWQWKGPKGSTPLYRLDELAKAPGAIVIVCEGEKAADAAQRRLGVGYVATSWMGGVAGVNRADLSPLAGRDVIVWPDADAPGAKAATALVARLRPTAKRVRVVRVDDLPAKADAADVSWTAAELEARVIEPEAAPRPTRVYHLQSVAEIRAQPLPPWLLVDLLPARGLCVWYGEPGSGKSFLALDLGAHSATGSRWANRRTRHAKVVYIALEGQLRDRIEAYKEHHGLDDSDLADLLVLQRQQVDLLTEGTAEQLAADVRAALGDYSGPVAVIVDTLARAMPGGNENASEDMGAVIAACGVIERELGALVILVHHAGKDSTRGARGWSGLRGAADAEVLIERDGDCRRATFAKVKDGQDGVAVEFRLEAVDLGPRSDVDPQAEPDERRTSCVAVLTDADAKPRTPEKPLGKNQRLLLTALRTSGPWMRKQCHDFMQAAGVPKNRRYEAIDSLLAAGVIEDTVTGLRAKT
jgi:hypothetical protein